MGAISQTNINCVGSHAGISIGEDGPSQMALEDLAMFRSIPGMFDCFCCVKTWLEMTPVSLFLQALRCSIRAMP